MTETPSWNGSSLHCLPRFATARDSSRRTLGDKVGEIAALLGQPLMPWQQFVADVALELDDSGRLRYRQVVVTVPRQSGKTTLGLSVMVHRALGFGERQRVLYTAQTRNDARRKWEDEHVFVLERSPLAKLLTVRRSNGSEQIQWSNGSTHGITSTTDVAGHGETLDLGFVDEAFAHKDDTVEQAFRPAMITRPQPQLWVVSTAGTEDSIYLNGKVEAGRASVSDPDSPIAYFEWSASEDADPDDPETWRSCMPALGLTVAEEAVAADHASMKPAEFRRAYLNLRSDRRSGDPVIDLDVWQSLADERSQAVEPVVFAVDVTPDRGNASIAVAGRRADGKWHVELIEHRPGARWVVDELTRLVDRWKPVAVVLDPGGPAGGLLPSLHEAGIEPLTVTSRQMAQGCAMVFDAVAGNELRHLGQSELNVAVAGARKRKIGDMWAWSRDSLSVDLSPLVAVTLAMWGHETSRSTVNVKEVAAPAIVSLADL